MFLYYEDERSPNILAAKPTKPFEVSIEPQPPDFDFRTGIMYASNEGEFLAARKVAEEIGAQIVVADRPVEITVRTFRFERLILVAFV
ncbi:hypothetical protein POTOM_049857 [Populus tomentosa]|uniref:Uncharacterized protein n=1 Tax=Populus tomentosa TaxID=118781 RepID=A0A8X7YFA9_POPTO|nr:hypothetical protein POTOM_049857 [Populus tomentosa]